MDLLTDIALKYLRVLYVRKFYCERCRDAKFVMIARGVLHGLSPGGRMRQLCKCNKMICTKCSQGNEEIGIPRTCAAIA